MNKQEFKEGQEVWLRCTVIVPEPTSDAEIIVAENNFSHEIWANLENIIVPRERVTIPKLVAERIEDYKIYDTTLLNVYKVLGAKKNDVSIWVNNNLDLFARAWLDGYEVEQEKLYTVEIPDPNNSSWEFTKLEKQEDGTLKIGHSNDLHWERELHNKLTESEIRKDFDWAWQAGFAKEVDQSKRPY